MFILTLDTNDPQKIRQALREFIDDPIVDDNGLGPLAGVQCEYETLPLQPFIAMSEFMHFNEDGETLKRP